MTLQNDLDLNTQINIIIQEYQFTTRRASAPNSGDRKIWAQKTHGQLACWYRCSPQVNQDISGEVDK